MRILRTCILYVVAAYCLVVSVVSPALVALGGGTADSAALEHRVKVIEAINIEHRLTKLETSLDGLQLQLHGAVGGVGALLVEAAVRIGRKRKGGA